MNPRVASGRDAGWGGRGWKRRSQSQSAEQIEPSWIGSLTSKNASSEFCKICGFWQCFNVCVTPRNIVTSVYCFALHFDVVPLPQTGFSGLGTPGGGGSWARGAVLGPGGVSRRPASFPNSSVLIHSGVLQPFLCRVFYGISRQGSTLSMGFRFLKDMALSFLFPIAAQRRRRRAKPRISQVGAQGGEGRI